MTTFAAILAATVVTAVLLLALVAVPVIVRRAAELGLNDTDMPEDKSPVVGITLAPDGMISRVSQAQILAIHGLDPDEILPPGDEPYRPGRSAD